MWSVPARRFRNIWLTFFGKAFLFPCFVAVLAYIGLENGPGLCGFSSADRLAGRQTGRSIRRSVESSQTKLGELNQILQETVGGNRIVKAFGMEDFETRKFRSAATRLLRETMRWVRAQVVTSPLMDLLQPVVISLLLLYARDKIRLQQMTVGLFFTFVYALFKSYEPVKRMGSVYQQFQQAQGATTQVFAYLDLAEEERDAPGALPFAGIFS